MIAQDSIAAIIPANTGRLSNGMISTTTAKQPDKLPEKPRPVMALPTTNISDVVLVAHTREPIKKMMLLITKTTLVGNNLYIFA